MYIILGASFLLSLFSFFNLLGINSTYAYTQLGFILFGILIYIFAKVLGIGFFKKNYKFLYWLFIFLLLLVFLIGDEVRGSKRWIDLYFLNFQPSEFFKIIFIIFISKFISLNEENLEKRNIYFSSLFYLLIPFIIVYKQPDLGNALVYISIFVSINLLSKIPKKFIYNTFIVLLVTLPLLWSFLKDYQKNRIISFVVKTENVTEINYNSVQSMISVGSGKFLGRGLGYGTQSRLSFLPENHTDFAYSTLTEQFGFVGSFTILFLFLLICIELLKLILKLSSNPTLSNRFYLYYSIGFLSYFTFQVFVNIAMNLGTFPIAGVALPIISYGGSSLSTYILGIALLPFDKV
ncbi:MAG: FtsW/RodA/SpoVE family cell cycle protein [Nanoarchaeota archaeon]